MNILIRADSSSTIGTGHIMRDLVLAKQYADSKIIFATQELAGNLNFKVVESGYKVKNLLSNDLDELITAIEELQIDMIIIDHYDIDYKFEKALKEEYPSLIIFSFDDTYEKHHCDILLNHNISGNEKRYKGLVPKYCELRCGSQYTLLRDEFIEEKRKKTVFLAMGGSDSSNINIKILEVLSNFRDIEVNLVTTIANQNLEELKRYIENKQWINLYINSNKIARLMKISDFAIITPSVTLNEIFYMEIPFVAIQTAENQKDMYKYLIEKKFLVMKEFNQNELKSKIIRLKGDIK